MYDVKRFVKSKREDWDNGCMNMERTDLDYFRYERTHSAMGDVMREYLFRSDPIQNKLNDRLVNLSRWVSHRAVGSYNIDTTLTLLERKVYEIKDAVRLCKIPTTGKVSSSRHAHTRETLRVYTKLRMSRCL